MKRTLWLVLLTMMAITGCGTGKPAAIGETKKREIAETIRQLAGKDAEFQANRSIAEWTPEGRSQIKALLDDVLPTLEPVGVISEGTSAADRDHVYARYGDKATFYFPVKRKQPENEIVLKLGNERYLLRGDKQKVGQLLDWAASQSIY